MLRMVNTSHRCSRINNEWLDMKIFRCIAYSLIAVLSVGCKSFDVGVDDQPSNPGNPTVPIKRRPIVPTTKLPRPRVIEMWWYGANKLNMELAPQVQSVNVDVVDLESGDVTSYFFDSRIVELYNLPEGDFEIIVEADGEVEVFEVEAYDAEAEYCEEW